MKKLDWYILKKFLLTFFFCILLFTIVAVAIDTSEKTDDFVRANLTFSQIITRYYLGFIPWIWSLLFPLFVFIAVIFFTSRLATRSEIIAILASGTSYRRFLRPYLIGGLLLAGLLWVGSRYWIPRANVIRSNFQSKYVDAHDQTKNLPSDVCATCFYRRLDSNTFFGLRNFDTLSKTARGFFMDKISNNRLVYNLRAELLRWDTATRKWSLINVAERTLDSTGEKTVYRQTMDIDLGVKPTDFRRDYYLKDKFTTPELKRYLVQEEARGTEGLSALRVEYYRRTATPAAVLLLTLIGAVIASRRTRGGSGVHLAMGLLIAALFVLSDRFSTVFATQGNFAPMLAAWLPDIAFSGVALWLYRQTPK